MGFLSPLLPSRTEYSSAAVGLKPPQNHETLNELGTWKNSFILSPVRMEIWLTKLMKLADSSEDMKMIKSVDKRFFQLSSDGKSLMAIMAQ